MSGKEDHIIFFCAMSNSEKIEKVFEVFRNRCLDIIGTGVRGFSEGVFEVERNLHCSLSLYRKGMRRPLLSLPPTRRLRNGGISLPMMWLQLRYWTGYCTTVILSLFRGRVTG